MTRYALLTRESSNRVFGSAAPEMLLAEVLAIGKHLSAGISDTEPMALGGMSYVCFDSVLGDTDRFILSNLALARGLFEFVEATPGAAALRPLDITPLEWFPSDLITIQRYRGKTNEQFTHLLVNLTLAESLEAHARASAGKRVRLFDPVAGRGSTLNRGLVYGFDVGGVELDDTSVDQYKTFLTTYLKDRRVKHKAETERIRKGKHAGTSAFDVSIRPGSSGQHVRLARASTEQTRGLFAGAKFDVLVGDLPYGIRHKSSSKALDRSPTDLVQGAIDSWRSVMSPRASLGLSWNTKTMPREQLTEVLTENGFVVTAHPRSFEHVVDRQITRDLLVAVKA